MSPPECPTINPPECPTEDPEESAEDMHAFFDGIISGRFHLLQFLHGYDKSEIFRQRMLFAKRQQNLIVLGSRSF